MRERKAVKVVGRNQFASLFHALNISSALVRNKKLLFTHGANVNSVKLRSRRVPRLLYRKHEFQLYRESEEREKSENYVQEINKESSLILSCTADTLASLQTRKKSVGQN